MESKGQGRWLCSRPDIDNSHLHLHTCQQSTWACGIIQHVLRCLAYGDNVLGMQNSTESTHWITRSIAERKRTCRPAEAYIYATERPQIQMTAHHVHTLQATGICCAARACKVPMSVSRPLASELKAHAMQQSSALAVVWKWEVSFTNRVATPVKEVRWHHCSPGWSAAWTGSLSTYSPQDALN